MRVSAGAVCLGLGVLLGANATSAEPAQPAGPAPAMELLEYLGGLVEERDAWVGPDDMQGMSSERDAKIVIDDDAADAARVK